MLTTKYKPLVIEDAPEMRYRPLPGLDVADYIEDHIARFHQTGVLDYLSISGQGVNFEAVRSLDLSALGVVGEAVARVFSTDGGATPRRLRDEILDHCTRFHVCVKDESGGWQPLDSPDVINDALTFEQMAEVVKKLAGELLAPLWNRLVSSVEARQSESATSSPESSTES